MACIAFSTHPADASAWWAVAYRFFLQCGRLPSEIAKLERLDAIPSAPVHTMHEAGYANWEIDTARWEDSVLEVSSNQILPRLHNRTRLCCYLGYSEDPWVEPLGRSFERVIILVPAKVTGGGSELIRRISRMMARQVPITGYLECGIGVP
ncbi:MAG: hypothetical protein ACKN94_10145 [Pirellulaceae bacterium]